MTGAEIISAVVALITGAIAIYKAVKAKEYSNALDLSDTTLKGIIAAIELLPEGDKKQEVKTQIMGLSMWLHTEKPKLHALVKQITALLAEAGIASDSDGPHLFRAAAVIKEMEARKNAK